jgi:hypothetical protein
MKQIRLILFLFLICLANGFAQTLIYKQISDDKVILHTYLIQPSGSGYVIQLNRESESLQVYEEFVLDSLYQTLDWKYQNEQTGTDISVSRHDRVILLTGIHKNQIIEKKFSIDPLPWAQLFPIGLETLAAFHRKKMKFYAISTTSPAEMKIAKFAAKIQDHETIICDGDSVDAVHMRISFTGWKSVLWHGDCWFRKSDHRYIKWDAPGPPGHPRSVVELISE